MALELLSIDLVELKPIKLIISPGEIEAKQKKETTLYFDFKHDGLIHMLTVSVETYIWNLTAAKIPLINVESETIYRFTSANNYLFLKPINDFLLQSLIKFGNLAIAHNIGMIKALTNKTDLINLMPALPSDEELAARIRADSDKFLLKNLN